MNLKPLYEHAEQHQQVGDPNPANTKSVSKLKFSEDFESCSQSNEIESSDDFVCVDSDTDI